jgi:hypothetical protein
MQLAGLVVFQRELLHIGRRKLPSPSLGMSLQQGLKIDAS